MGRHGENIRRRKDGRWEGRYKVFDENKGRTIYRSVYSNTYEKVKEKLSKARLGFIGNTEKKKNHAIPVTFSQAAKEWLETIADRQKYSTYVKYSAVYQNHLEGIIGACTLSALIGQEIREKIFDHLSERNLSESMQKSIFCIVNQILDFANQKYTVGVPLLKGPVLKAKKKIIRTLSRAEQARLLFSVRQELDKFKVAVLLCLYTGIRLGELCALQWTDIDFSGAALTVNRTVQRIAVQGSAAKTALLETDPKSESAKRVIPLTAEIMELLLQFKEKKPYVFGGEKPLEPRTMQYRFKAILKEAEIEDRNFHLLRHTFATNCVENKMDVKTLSEILGHSDIKISMNRYVHPTMVLKRKQLEMLPDFYGQICGQICGHAA